MQGQIIWLIRSQDVRVILRIVERLRGYNLAPEEPTTGEFRAWGSTVKDAGEYWVATPSDLIKSWESDRLDEVSFQLWRIESLGKTWVSNAAFSAGDTLVTLKHWMGHSLLIFGLDGWTAEEAETLVATLLWNAITEPESLALLADRTESRAEWEAFLADPAVPVPPTAELVWLADDSLRPRVLWARQGAWPGL